MPEEVRRRELVALFESHGALAEPALLGELAAAPDGAVRAQAVLNGLAEIPFHFDRSLWSRLEQQSRAAVVKPAPEPTEDPTVALARKEALRRAAAAVYDG